MMKDSNRRNFCRAMLIWMGIRVVWSVILATL